MERYTIVYNDYRKQFEIAGVKEAITLRDCFGDIIVIEDIDYMQAIQYIKYGIPNDILNEKGINI
jgi:hypothetical protein